MITLKTSKGMCAELYGLSTDTKPSDVANASTFFEMDSGILYMFDAASNEWYMIVGGLPADPAFSSVTVEDLNEDGVSMRGGFEGDNDDEPVLTLEGTDDGHSPVRIAGVAEPQEDDEAANKAYVDAFGQRITTLEAKRKMAYVNDWVPDSYLESVPYDVSWFFPAAESGDFVVDKRGHLGVVVSIDSDSDLVTVRGAGEGPVSLTNEPTVEVIDNTTTPSIIAADNTIYKCGELTSLTVSSSPVTGQYSIVFTSGATATTTSFPNTILGLESFAADVNTLYEINVLDNRAVVGSWAVSSS